ncbi:MAG: flagellar biosynthetic protein FliO [Candidatus Competibacter denitrificans]
MSGRSTMATALLALPGLAVGAEIGRPEAAVTALPGSAMLGQLSLGLVAVLVVAVGLSWLARRYALPKDGLIRVIGGLPLSNRERLLVIEIDQTRLLIGITPQQIQTLHVLAAPSTQPAEPLPFSLAPLTPELPNDAAKP